MGRPAQTEIATLQCKKWMNRWIYTAKLTIMIVWWELDKLLYCSHRITSRLYVSWATKEDDRILTWSRKWMRRTITGLKMNNDVPRLMGCGSWLIVTRALDSWQTGRRYRNTGPCLFLVWEKHFLEIWQHSGHRHCVLIAMWKAAVQKAKGIVVLWLPNR